MKIQIELSRFKDPKTNKERPFKYSDIPQAHKPQGWVSTKEYLPIPFDLMKLRVETMDRDVPGWWTWQNWEGLRLRPGRRILKWKRELEYD
jgi:hypothetical protein